MKRLFLLLTLMSPQVFAGNEHGNGGEGVVCRKDNRVTSVELLDFFEARTRGLVLDLGPQEWPMKLKIEMMLNKLARFDHTRAERYKRKAEEFFENARFVEGVKLPRTSDAGETLIPSHCAIEQLAIRRKPIFPEDKLYTVSKDLWDYLDVNNRAGLVLHEILGEETQTKVGDTSYHARRFNGLLCSSRFLELEPADYAEIATVVFRSFQARFFMRNQVSINLAPGEFLKIDPETYLSATGHEKMHSLFFYVPRPPKWLQHKTFNSIEGRPGESDAGVYEFNIGLGYKGKVIEYLSITVRVAQRPPQPLEEIRYENPVFIGKIFIGSDLTFDLTSQFKTGVHRISGFEVLKGPKWLHVTSNGVLFGRPNGNAGSFQAVLQFRVSPAGQNRTMTIFGETY